MISGNDFRRKQNRRFRFGDISGHTRLVSVVSGQSVSGQCGQWSVSQWSVVTRGWSVWSVVSQSVSGQWSHEAGRVTADRFTVQLSDKINAPNVTSRNFI